MSHSFIHHHLIHVVILATCCDKVLPSVIVASIHPALPCELSETTMLTEDGISSLHWVMHAQSHPRHEHTG